MKFKLLFLSSLLIYSCTNYEDETISLFNFLPSDSKVIVNINDLNNTKDILNNNEVLPILLSASKEISNQLDLLSNKNSEREGLFSLSTYGKNEIAFTYIRKSNSFDTISEVDTLKTKYQKSEIFLDEVNGEEINKVIIDQYIVSSNKDIILENIIRDFNSAKYNIDSEFKKIIKTSDSNEPFNIYSKSDNLGIFSDKLVDISFFPRS